MEVQGMDEGKKPEDHMTSAAAFVEGGIQDAYDDACSICLEEFCKSDPSTVTNCKHEFHLQCVLEWSQRSSQCPMCWQPISLKDPTSQELLEAVERERRIRTNPPRNATRFHHPAFGDFELQHLPVGASDSDIEERILQHLTAAAAMGRAHHFARRESRRTRSAGQGRPHYYVFSAHPDAQPGTVAHGGETEPATPASPSTPLASDGESSSRHILQFHQLQTDQNSTPNGSAVAQANRRGFSFNSRSTSSQTSPRNQDRAGPSDLQSFSESLKSRFHVVSMRYKESISKSTREWKERLFSRNASMPGAGSKPQTENAGPVRESNRGSQASVTSHSADRVVTEQNDQNNTETSGETHENINSTPASFASSSFSR